MKWNIRNFGAPLNFLLHDRHRKWRDIKRDPFIQFHSRKIFETGARFTRSETSGPLYNYVNAKIA